MKRCRRVSTLAAALVALGTVTVGTGLATPAAPAPPGRVDLPQGAPKLPANAARLGAAPAGQVLDLEVTLAGQDPAGLARAVAAVSTPGSPQYRHYLTPAQYAAAYGPSAAEVAQVSSTLRNEGLTVGAPLPGSTLLPVHGTAATVSAAFGTPIEAVQTPNAPRVLVNTATPQVPADLAGLVTGVAGLDGLFRQRSMLVHAHATAPSGGGVVASPANQGHGVANAATPQACAAAAGYTTFHPGTYTSTQLSSIFGLDQLFAQGRTGVGQTIAVVEFEQYQASDYNAFESCYGLSTPIRNVLIDGGPPGPPAGFGEASLDIELASYNAPSSSLVVYEAPNDNDAQSLDLLNRIVGDDAAQVVTTSWGNCEQFIQSSDPTYLTAESQIFSRMALQGQTMIAASGDAGSEDCFPNPGSPPDKSLAVDDPGSQPSVVSAGGTTLSGASAGSQVVWNDCEGQLTSTCAANAPLTDAGAGGGGASVLWPKPSYQDAADPETSARAVPDIAYPGNPVEGGVVAYFDGSWIGFGGTSVAAPTNAGLFADTNQGCFARLGQAGPALYAAAGGANFTDVTAGNNDFTDTHGGLYGASAGFDEASGLGTPVDQKLAVALQGGDGCPSVAAVSPNTGPGSGGGAVTVIGGGFANASSVTFGAAGTGRILAQSETSITVIPPTAPGPQCVDVTVANPQGISAASPADHYGYDGDLNCGTGYRFVASDGGVFDFGDAGFWGSTGSLTLNAPVVGMADTPSTNGYWLVASDGGIFSFGDAGFFGSMGGQHLNKPIVGMAGAPGGGGYWLVASDGGIFSFGDAGFFGSTGSMRLNQPIVGMAPSPDGHGYWLVASDGGIFSYGDAQFRGSTGSLVLNKPMVGMAATPDGGGYWLVASDGGVFDYGDAGFFGSAGSIRLNQPVVGIAGTPDGAGYWLVAADGGIFTYGDAPFFGSTGSLRLNKPIVGMSSA